VTLHRFVHIGDLHLGPNSRNADRRAALDQIIAEQRTQPVAAWLIPGDLNHGRQTIEDKNYLTDRVIQMADHAPVVIAYGNHDLPGDLDYLTRLHSAWPIYVVTRPEVLTVPLGTGGVAAIYVLPYPTRAGLIGAGVPSDGVVDAARGALDIMFMSAAAQLEEARKGGAVTLVIGHVNVAGSVSSSGQPNIGKEIEVDPALLQRFGNIYIGLNHIHKGQAIAGAVYPGSVCRLDWGEVEEKHYLIVECAADGSFQWWPQPIDVAPMYHVEGELTRESFTWHLGDTPGDAPESWDGCEVRVRYRYNAEEKAALNVDLVAAPFAGAKRLEFDPIAVRTRAVRSPEVAAAVTLEAKVEAFVRMSGLPWGEGMETKFAALQNPDGAAFLTQVQQELSGAVGSTQSRDGSASSVAVPDSDLAGVAL